MTSESIGVIGVSRPCSTRWREQLRVVDDLVVAAELRVFAVERVEAVRTGRHDAGGLGLVEGLDVLLREHLEHELVAQTPGRVPRACLGLAEHGEAHARDVQQLREGT